MSEVEELKTRIAELEQIDRDRIAQHEKDRAEWKIAEKNLEDALRVVDIAEEALREQRKVLIFDNEYITESASVLDLDSVLAAISALKEKEAKISEQQ